MSRYNWPDRGAGGYAPWPASGQDYTQWPPGDAGDGIVRPNPIRSAQAFGTLSVHMQVAPDSITSEEAFGTPTVTTQVWPSSISSDEGLGEPVVTIEGNLILDQLVQTVLGAWSVSHRLTVDYSGSLIRVARVNGTTNPEQDIGYDGDGLLDTAAIASHCGSDPGRVVTVYDQSGNGRNLTAAALTNAPTIWDGSAIIVQGTASTPAMSFDGTDDYLGRSDACGLSGNPGISAWFTYRHDTGGGFYNIWGVGNTSTGQYIGQAYAPNGNQFGTYNHVGDVDYNNPAPQTWGSYHQVFDSGGTTVDQSAERNGSAMSVSGSYGDTNSPNLGNTATRWGASTNDDSFMIGWSSTLILMAAADVDDDAALDTWFADMM